jgi:hypothetical protein
MMPSRKKFVLNVIIAATWFAIVVYLFAQYIAHVYRTDGRDLSYTIPRPRSDERLLVDISETVHGRTRTTLPSWRNTVIIISLYREAQLVDTQRFKGWELEFQIIVLPKRIDIVFEHWTVFRTADELQDFICDGSSKVPVDCPKEKIRDYWLALPPMPRLYSTGRTTETRTIDPHSAEAREIRALVKPYLDLILLVYEYKELKNIVRDAP